MDIKPIKTRSDYGAALKAVDALMNARANTPEGDRLDVLVTLIEAYERKQFPMDLPDAVEAIKFRMEQQGLTAKDLEPMIGRTNRRLRSAEPKAGSDARDDPPAPRGSGDPGREPPQAGHGGRVKALLQWFKW